MDTATIIEVFIALGVGSLGVEAARRLLNWGPYKRKESLDASKVIEAMSLDLSQRLEQEARDVRQQLQTAQAQMAAMQAELDKAATKMRHLASDVDDCVAWMRQAKTLLEVHRIAVPPMPNLGQYGL